ncbi:hypothetical protein GCWU000341_00760 [Oribacterium sp. oral taxon 078 str. F0262]|nr:hypothetical protein GCWU000341_00760 [Oribacterium sp. oral taxon 078 str. F0262]
MRRWPRQPERERPGPGGQRAEKAAALRPFLCSLREDSSTLRVCLMADFCALSSLLRSEGLGFARVASADLPSGDTSLREVVKDAPSLPDGRLLRSISFR